MFGYLKTAFNIAKRGFKLVKGIVKGIKDRKQGKADGKKGAPIVWSSRERPIDLQEVVVNPKRDLFLPPDKPFDLNEYVKLPYVNFKPDDQSTSMMKTIAIAGGALFVAMLVIFGLKKK